MAQLSRPSWLGQNIFPALVILRRMRRLIQTPQLASVLSSVSKLCPKAIREEAVYTLGRGVEGRALGNGLVMAHFLQGPLSLGLLSPH